MIPEPVKEGQPKEAFKVLAGITHISQAQQSVVDNLWKLTGRCAGCDKIIRPEDPKHAIATINTSHAYIALLRNTVGILIYCLSCDQILEMTLRGLKPRHKIEKTSVVR